MDNNCERIREAGNERCRQSGLGFSNTLSAEHVRSSFVCCLQGLLRRFLSISTAVTSGLASRASAKLGDFRGGVAVPDTLYTAVPILCVLQHLAPTPPLQVLLLSQHRSEAAAMTTNGARAVHTLRWLKGRPLYDAVGHTLLRC